MNRRMNDSFGFYLIDESELPTFYHFREELLKEEFGTVKQKVSEMTEALLNDNSSIKCTNLLFKSITEEDKEDTINYLKRIEGKLGNEKPTLGEIRYLLKFFFHYTCSVLGKSCWFAMLEINFST